MHLCNLLTRYARPCFTVARLLFSQVPPCERSAWAREALLIAKLSGLDRNKQGWLQTELAHWAVGTAGSEQGCSDAREWLSCHWWDKLYSAEKEADFPYPRSLQRSAHGDGEHFFTKVPWASKEMSEHSIGEIVWRETAAAGAGEEGPIFQQDITNSVRLLQVRSPGECVPMQCACSCSCTCPSRGPTVCIQNVRVSLARDSVMISPDIPSCLCSFPPRWNNTSSQLRSPANTRGVLLRFVRW